MHKTAYSRLFYEENKNDDDFVIALKKLSNFLFQPQFTPK